MGLELVSADNRPRERLQEKGPTALSNAELIALMLRTGNQEENVLELAHRVLCSYELASLSRATFNELSSIKGVGVAKASQLVACFELARRILAFEGKEKKFIQGAADIAAIYLPHFSFLNNECCIGIYLDARQRIIGEQVLSSGTNNATIVSPKDVFHHALRLGASAVIIMHNHPSGDSSPSDEDIAFTQELVAAGDLMGLVVLDHIIFGNNTYTSLRESKHLS